MENSNINVDSNENKVAKILDSARSSSIGTHRPIMFLYSAFTVILIWFSLFGDGSRLGVGAYVVILLCIAVIYLHWRAIVALKARQRSGRTLTIVLSIPLALVFPVGTILAALLAWPMLRKEWREND